MDQIRPLASALLCVCVFCGAMPQAVHAAGASTPEELTEAERTRLGELFAKAKAEVDAGNFPQAIESLEAAYVLLQEPGIQRRLGDLYERVNQPQNAIKAYALYLKLSPNASDARRIQAQIKGLERANLGTLHITSTPDGASVELAPKGGTFVQKGKTPLHLEQLPPGTYDIQLRAPNHQPRTQTVTLAQGGSLNVVLDLVEDEAPVAALKAQAAPGAEPQERGVPTMTWVLGGVGAASALVAGGSLVWARALGQDLDEMEAAPNPEGRPKAYDDTISRHNTLQVTGLVAAGVALLSLSGAGVVWVYADEGSSPSASGLGVSASPSSLAASWTLQF